MRVTKEHLLIVFCFVFVSSGKHLLGQTLTEKLVKESPARLVKDAKKSGNVVRGAILFHQGNLNCAKCHRAKSEKDRIGPDLSRAGKDLTDELIVEAILQPSKTIRKGFETVSVLTLEGETLEGIIVRQDERQMILRGRKNVDQIFTIEKKNIDETRPAKTSSMPDKLADQLKNRKQFLDLVRYVIETRDRGPTADSTADQSANRRQLTPELQGIQLVNQLNCVSCHDAGDQKSVMRANQAPDLRWSAKHLNPEYLAKFIADPDSQKPGSTMPHVLGHLEKETRVETANAITQFLVSVAENNFKTQSIQQESIEPGFRLFQSIGCVACHSPRNSKAEEQPVKDSIPLGDIHQKYNVTALTTFLEKPHVVRSSGRMPNMLLTRREAINIASFLLQSPNKQSPDSKWKKDSSLVEKGMQQFKELGCSQCHTNLLKRNDNSQTYPSLAKLDSQKGCLSDNANQKAKLPDYRLTADEKRVIREALKSQSKKLSDQQLIDLTLVTFNCTACHQRDGLGGVAAARDPHFQTTNLNLGDQGRIPPALSGVGAKLKAKWLRDVLINRRVIRPYMKTRMPQFGEENIGHLVDLFQKSDRVPSVEFAKFKNQKETRKQGHFLTGNQGLNCVACHTYKYKLSDTMPAVDLTEMAERLKKEWFYQYMLAPQKYSPNTVMPSFWPNGKAIRKDIEGSPEVQIEALWQYLIDGRQAATPRGVIREPLEIVVGNEAQMLRRSYQGIGKRGIGVGYPGSVNLAFDAEQMRLAKIWKGKFVDPSGVWYGQGSGTVRPKGKTIDFPKGPELDDASSPWVADNGRPPKHQFKGYVLDKKRRPAFHYVFGSVLVEDFFFEHRDEKTKKVQLRRRVKLTSSKQRKNLRFRIAENSKIESTDKNVFSIGKQLKIRIISKHDANVVKGKSGSSLLVPFDLEAGNVQELVIEYQWEAP